MRILYIYRSKDAGPSIRRVFEPIEQELSKTDKVASLYLPTLQANITGIIKNCMYVRSHLKHNVYDVVHITGDVYYLLFALSDSTTVVTVHDLGFFTNNKISIHTLLRYMFWILPLRKASFITFISKKSYDEASKLVKLRTERMAVISNPYDMAFSYTAKDCNASNPIILHVGTKPNKNLSRVIAALSDINCKLHIIGKLSKQDREQLDCSGIDYHNDEYVSDGELVEAYQRCDIVSFPSLYEGFGMPIIEAQAVGRPVVTSDLSPMKEIAGIGAILVNPDNVSSIRQGFLNAISNYDNIVISGLQNVKMYSVANIAGEFKKVYCEINNKQNAKN